MAYRWRIRHKLMLGLGLDVAVMALLLGGSLYGIFSYDTTVKNIESKVAELEAAISFKDALKGLNSREPAKLKEDLKKVQEALASYERCLDHTLDRGRDPDRGYQEKGLVLKLHDKLAKLDDEAKETDSFDVSVSSTNRDPQPSQDNHKPLIDALVRDADDLCLELYGNLKSRGRDAKQPFRMSLGIVITTSVAGMLLMMGLVRFFYRCVFYPIRDLEHGAQRVAQGNFEQRLEVHTGDEMEDLANAFNDMTGRLQEMYGDLSRQVNERSRQLVRSERLASVGFLAAGVAHEINNPLASIAFCGEALEKRLTGILARNPADSEVIAKYLKMIQEEAFRCKEITQRLLEFSRGGERRREPADLGAVVQAVLDMVQHLQCYKGRRITFQPYCRLTAWVNAQEIKSVVLNLVVNALDSMDDGGTLTITLGQREGMAEIVFEDTGCGMPPDVLENIFEPFFTRSRTGKGTGLGLSISHRVISQHGGEIEADSPGVNQGSTFTVRLPLQPAETLKEESLGHAAAA